MNDAGAADSEFQSQKAAFMAAHAGLPIVVDLGANNGDDCDFYLRKGFRAVAIEADPEMAAVIRARFPEALAAQKLLVCNVAIAAARQTLTFYKNAFSEWSSLKPGGKATQTHTFQPIEVQGETLGALLEGIGPLRYIKMDIEGNELDAVRSLVASPLRPGFLSFEFNNDQKRITQLLGACGYAGFQLIRQGAKFLAPSSVPAREGASVEAAFKNSMSGSFGNDLPDAWASAAELERLIERMQAERQERIARKELPGWFDVHARLG
jgi:FkbM family methyltransferase